LIGKRYRSRRRGIRLKRRNITRGPALHAAEAMGTEESLATAETRGACRARESGGGEIVRIADAEGWIIAAGGERRGWDGLRKS